jgi:quercetin dioxygenase-like cupin family protein
LRRNINAGLQLLNKNMTQSDLFQSEEKTGWKTVGKGIQRQVFGYNDKVMLVKVKFEKGGCGELHSHEHSQVTYVESGVFEVTIDGTKKTISKGDGFYAPPFTIHGCVCMEAGMLIDAFAPGRWEFLESD